MRILIFGATGMVGQGVLRECLEASDVEQVVAVGRTPTGVTHERLAEVVAPDLFALTALREQLAPFDACFFCLGVSSVGMKEDQYTRITYDLTLSVARLLHSLNPAMTFIYDALSNDLHGGDAVVRRDPGALAEVARDVD